MTQFTYDRIQIKSLAAEIRHHKRLYYLDAKPEISDAEFDALEAQLRDLDPDHPVLKEVGSDLMGFGDKVQHRFPMGSLDKIHTEDEVRSWIKSHSETPVFAEWKLDGLAMSLLYLNGKLIRAASRGDGVEGELVTENALQVSWIPASIDPIKFFGEWEFRGEVVCSRRELQAILF